MITQFLRRCGQCVLPVLMSADIFLCSVWLSLLYPFGLARRPTGREMVSTYVGEALYNGMPWARRAAAVIDWVFVKLGAPPEHCARNYLVYHAHDDYSYPRPPAQPDAPGVPGVPAPRVEFGQNDSA